MKKFIFALPILLLSAYGCTENNRALFDANPSVYFASYTNLDTVKYSFMMTESTEFTLDADIALIGRKPTGEARFEIKVNDTSTAVAGTHYEELPRQIVFPDGQYNCTLPIRLLDRDAKLKDRSVLLSISLVATDDMEIGLPSNSTFNVTISDMLVQPSYWVPNMNNAFGEYSRVKHERIVIILGHDFPLTVAEANSFVPENMPNITGLAYWQLMGRKVCDWFVNNPTLDENGNPITAWEPL